MSQPTAVPNGNHAETEMSKLTMASKPLAAQPVVPEKVNGTTNGYANGTTTTSTSNYDSHKESHSETKVTSQSLQCSLFLAIR